MRNQKEPNALTCGQRRWNSPARCRSARPRSRCITGSTGRSRGRSRRGAAAGRSPAVRALVLRRARRQPRDRAPRARGADGRRPRESRGRGSFITGDAVVEPPNTLMSLSEVARSRGLDAGARVLGADVRPATIDEAEAFGIAPGAEVFELRRLRMLDGLPISIDINRVPLRLLPEAPDMDFTRPRSTRHSTAPATRPAARTTSSRRAERTAPRQSCSTWRRARRSCSRPRRRSPRTAGSSTSAVPCTGGSLSVPGDADAPRSPGREGDSMRKRALLAALARRRHRRMRRDTGRGEPE